MDVLKVFLLVPFDHLSISRADLKSALLWTLLDFMSIGPFSENVQNNFNDLILPFL